MRARALMVVSFGAVLHACASSPEPPRMEDWVRVGVSPSEEAGQVRETLEAGGWRTTRTIERPGFVAMALRRGEGERAVRVVTSRGLVVALDSHETDGYRIRHGLVDLGEDEPSDLDGDGSEELLVWRRVGSRACLAVLRFDDGGGATVMADDAAALREGACVSRLEDVDADGLPEAIVSLRWPALTFGDHAALVEVALVERDGAWRAGHMPSVYLERQREAREAALASARASRDLSAVVALGVEVAAFALLTGAALSAQVERFDEALAGLVLSDEERDRIAEIRAVIASGWRDTSR